MHTIPRRRSPAQVPRLRAQARIPLQVFRLADMAGVAACQRVQGAGAKAGTGGRIVTIITPACYLTTTFFGSIMLLVEAINMDSGFVVSRQLNCSVCAAFSATNVPGSLDRLPRQQPVSSQEPGTFCVRGKQAMDGEKKCSKCKKVKIIQEFKKDSRYRDGRSSWCKQCLRDYATIHCHRTKVARGRYKGVIKHTKDNPYETAGSRGHRMLCWRENGKVIREQKHRRIWSGCFGPIPEGYVIHHIDGNKLNNQIDNLRCMPLPEHARLHRLEQLTSARSARFEHGECPL
jgi:hypothetical protein